MATRISRFLTALPVLAGLLATCANAQPEVEPNNSISQANGPFSLGSTMTGTILPGESDYFALDITSTTGIMLSVFGDQIGMCPVSFDPVVRIFNAAGSELAMLDDTSTSFCPEMNPTNRPAIANLQPGTYFVQVTCLAALPGQMYHLTTSRAVSAETVSEKFTYQGELKSGGVAFNGYKQMKFSLWIDPFEHALGTRVSIPVLYQYVEVVDGKFTVDLDFTIPYIAAVFDGKERYLEIEIADENGANPVVLEPRQRLAPSPYSIHSLKAGAADTASTAAQAQHADFANAAGSAMSADYAEQTQWVGVTGKPVGFADNTDNEGGWTENSGTSFTANRVGVNTGLPGAFNLAVNGTAAKTGGGSWSVFSDERLKHDITPMSGTLDRLMRLHGYSYEYNKEAVESRLALPGRQIGLLAQEVERVFPDWVEKDEQGFRYVTERATTALMVEALRDLRSEKDAQLKDLQRENEILRARLERIEASLAQLK